MLNSQRSFVSSMDPYSLPAELQWALEPSTGGSHSRPSCAVLALDLQAVEEIGSCDKLFVAAKCDEVVLVNSSLKHSVSQSKCVVVNNVAFEWIRGISLQGYSLSPASLQPPQHSLLMALHAL